MSTLDFSKSLSKTICSLKALVSSFSSSGFRGDFLDADP
jgi:hypothetical protein